MTASFQGIRLSMNSSVRLPSANGTRLRTKFRYFRTSRSLALAVSTRLLSRIRLKGSTVLADKAYGKWALREFIANHDADFCIPPKENEPDPWFVDWWLYKERHLVEKFFLKVKEFRRVAIRYDKLAPRFLAFVHLACIRILLA